MMLCAALAVVRPVGGATEAELNEDSACGVFSWVFVSGLIVGFAAGAMTCACLMSSRSSGHRRRATAGEACCAMRPSRGR